MSNYNSLQQVFLISMPHLKNPFLARSVIYLWEYNEKGACGIMINKLMDFTLQEVLKHLDIKAEDPRIDDYPVLQGGPNSIGQGFIIYRHPNASDHGNEKKTEITISSSKQDLADIAKGIGLGDCLISLGCTRWHEKELDKELANNDWLVAPFNEEVLFSPLNSESAKKSIFTKWCDAAATFGLDLNRISANMGHA